MPTIKDIAKAAGVSHGTVSNVLNKRGGVSYDKIRLVEETARSMGYTIDEKASLLRKGKGKTLALILPNLEDRQYVDLYAGVLRCADKEHYSLRLLLTNDMPYQERRAIREALALKVCGILTVSCLENHKSEYQEFSARNLTPLFLERPAQGNVFPCYMFDLKGAAEHLASQILREHTIKDYESIRVLTGNLQFEDQRLFSDVLCKQLSIPYDCICQNIRANQSEAAYALLMNNIIPDIVICTGESLSDKVRQIYLETGLPVPALYTLISLRTSQYTTCSAMSLNYRMLGYEAAAAAILQAKGSNLLSSKVFPVLHCKPFNGFPPIKHEHTLRILAHDTPAVTALHFLLTRFTAQYGIPVEMHACTMDQVKAELLSGRAADWDVLRIDPSHLAYMGPRLFRPLCQIDGSAATQLDRFLPKLQTDFSHVGKELYALPFDIGVQLLFYQRAVFDDIGQQRAFYEQTGKSLVIPNNFSDFDQIAKFFCRTYRPDSPTKFGSSLAPFRPSSIFTDYLPRLMAAGGLIYNSSGYLELVTPIAIQVLKDYIEYASYTNFRSSGSWSQIAKDFINGQTAMTILYANHSSHFVRNQSPNIGVEIGVSPIPGGHPLLGGGSLCIGRNCAFPEEAYRFISWATGDEIAAELVMLGGTSACRSVYEQREILDTYPWLSELPFDIHQGIRQAIPALSQPDFPQYEFERILGKHLIAALSGQETAEQALSSTQDEISAFLQ